MTPRDRKVSGLDKLTIVIASLSLAVSVLAGGVSFAAWKRPLPPDPTSIPRFGQGDDYETIDGTRFFRFLDDHSHRKIHIMAAIDDSKVEVVEDKDGSTSIQVPHECTPEEQDEDGKCELQEDILIIHGASGLEFSAGWVLRGYFANSGKVSHRQGLAHWEITAMDIVAAVS
jgi:hypothetical protein